MIALALCGFAFGICYLAARRSLVAGLAAVIAVGYSYGIVRANVPSTFSHFIFDSGVLGLYAAQLFKVIPEADRARIQPLLPWLAILIGWPSLLVLLPLQDPMVQLVGLRAHIFFLPFLLLGARLQRTEVERLTLWVAVLNLGAFGFALAEFFLGVDRFYPRNEVTELIYRSRDIMTSSALGIFRIPAVFGNAALYGSTMVITLPLLLGLWTQREVNSRRRIFVAAAIAATSLGVFLSATRMNMIALGVLVLATLISGRFGVAQRIGTLVMIGVVAWVVSQEERLFQRLLTLNSDTIVERISWSVNSSLVHFAFDFPLGNGLGGGGTSIPYFLQHLIREPHSIENQYGTILLEQGVPGVFIWFAFIIWALTRRTTTRNDPWFLGRRLFWLAAATFFGQALLGQGLFTAVPVSALLLLWLGWLVVRQPPVTDAAPTIYRQPEFVRTMAPEPLGLRESGSA